MDASAGANASSNVRATDTAAERRERALPSLWIRISDATGDLALAFLFLLTWLRPDASWALPLQVALLTMLLEFIVVHSSGFMGIAALGAGTRWKRAGRMIGLGLFYTLFVAGFAIGFATWWPLLAFWGLTLNRSLVVILEDRPGPGEALQIRKGWGAVTMTYLVGVGVTTVFPVPPLGIDSSVIAGANLPSSGLWIQEPYRVLAAGVLHFGLSGLSALKGHAWMSDRSVARSRAPTLT